MRAINTRASAGSPSLSLFKVLLTVDVRVVNKIVKPYGLRIAKATWAKNCKGNAHPPWIRTQKLDKLQMQIHSHVINKNPQIQAMISRTQVFSLMDLVTVCPNGAMTISDRIAVSGARVPKINN
tara:strand:+ start:148 stop:519 length:372 start_codon:yes stop_codon:yes gene_type:complete